MEYIEISVMLNGLAALSNRVINSSVDGISDAEVALLNGDVDTNDKETLESIDKLSNRINMVINQLYCAGYSKEVSKYQQLPTLLKSLLQNEPKENGATTFSETGDCFKQNV